MKRLVRPILVLLLLLLLTGCGKYVSGYKAVAFVRSNTAHSASMSFYSFEGRMVFRMKSTREGDIRCEAKLESGKAKVTYDYLGNSEELFSVTGGQEVKAHEGYVDNGTVYIIVETDGKCTNGSFRFEVD